MKTILRYISYSSLVVITSLTFCSCLKEESPFVEQSNVVSKITLSGEIEQLYRTRVNDDGFCDGDQVGIYVVDYEGSAAGTLQLEGNRADNVKHTYRESSNHWIPDKDIYWKDERTKVDIYGYYPYASPTDISSYPFELQKDQSTATAYGVLGGYEASDFLWGKTKGVAPTPSTIQVTFRHKMASVKVMLEEGEGFTEGEWTTLNKSVLVLNTKRSATIDLSTGVVTAVGEVPNTGTIPLYDNGSYRAIVAPQEVAANVPLLSISVGHANYLFTKTDAMTYLMGKQHNFTIKVDKRSDGGTDFTVVGESITPWENDNVTHDATAREYIVIHVAEAGTLEECIVAAGKDVAQVRNLKITGQINTKDFATMRVRMPVLQALNLKDATIAAGTGGVMGGVQYYANEDHEIPDYAFFRNESLQRLVLPDKLHKIGVSSFESCSKLTGSLLLPEGLTEIRDWAFSGCGFNGQLQLPSTLVYIGENALASDFNCELLLPNNLKYIGRRAFGGGGLRGSLVLPESLEYIGPLAFQGCANMTGSLTIPHKIKYIFDNTFADCGFNGTLILHDEIMHIDRSAFDLTKFRGELILPKNLKKIAFRTFNRCDFSGTLKLPENITSIGSYAFYENWRLSGIVDFPRSVQSIDEGAFRGCANIEGLVFGEGIESIGADAFFHCFGISSIVCKSAIPPYVYPNAFDGVPKDNFTLEVPQSSIALYQTAPGWSDFKRIAAHRELSVTPHFASALNASATRDLILRAKGDWEIKSKPDWVSFNKDSGTNVIELELTFDELSKGSDNREGEVVFKLTEEDYTVPFKVAQYNYDAYTEDEFVALQTASKGAGVNLVFLGDGFSAKDISEGTYIDLMEEAYGHFFNIEPYNSYKEYFNVYTGIAVSPESGIGNVNTIIDNKFKTYVLGGTTLGPNTPLCANCDNAIFEYVRRAPTVDDTNITKTLIVMVANTTDYGGSTYMYEDNRAIAYCSVSDYGYPYDFRGIIQCAAGGHGFGKLASEFVATNSFIDGLGVIMILKGKALGWYDNISLSGKLTEVPWSHFIFHERYNGIVDVFEGAFGYTRGVYRSEQSSCMINNIPYYNVISRESIVKRIMAYAGEEYSFSDFLEKDVIDGSVSTKAPEEFRIPMQYPFQHHPPIIIETAP